MNWIKGLVNLLVIVLLAIIPTLLGESLKNPVYVTYLVVIIILSAILQILIGNNDQNKGKITGLEDEISSLDKRYNSSILSLKAKGISYFDVAVLPLFYQEPRINREYMVRIFVNSKDKMTKPPELILTSEKDLEIKKLNTNIQRYFHNENHFFLLNETLEVTSENKYYHYEFEITFKESGENIFKLLAESKELKSEITNSFFIQ
ncbi:hypothetical protein ABGT22_19695 [Peribacillus frigoritolerans]|uniref:hypothetical protein n=1 Tax=Peribacillus frigoritolerans TaxID=450367 RepID=UPI00345DECA0